LIIEGLKVCYIIKIDANYFKTQIIDERKDNPRYSATSFDINVLMEREYLGNTRPLINNKFDKLDFDDGKNKSNIFIDSLMKTINEENFNNELSVNETIKSLLGKKLTTGKKTCGFMTDFKQKSKLNISNTQDNIPRFDVNKNCKILLTIQSIFQIQSLT
jgi:hypothetical protein